FNGSRQAFRFYARRSILQSRRPFFRFDQSSMRAVAIRIVFRFPAAADRDRPRFVEFQNAGSDARDPMRAVAKGRIFCPGTSAVGDAFRYLSDNGGLNEIIVGEWHGTSFPGC